MHRGSFPPPPRPLSEPPPYARDAGAAAADDGVLRSPRTSRRAFLLGAAGAFAALAALPFALRGGRRGGRGAAESPSDEARPGDGERPATLVPDAPESRAPQWAIALQYGSDEQLIAAAGDLEMVSSRFRSDQRLVPCFVRLLDAVLATRHPDGDTAGACAVRSLHRLGRSELVEEQAAVLARRPDLVGTQRAVARVLEDHRRRGGAGR